MMLSFYIDFSSRETAVQFETDCDYIEASVTDFQNWINHQSPPSNTQCKKGQSLSNFKEEDYWAYADYKYMKDLFRTEPNLCNVSKLFSNSRP